MVSTAPTKNSFPAYLLEVVAEILPSSALLGSVELKVKNYNKQYRQCMYIQVTLWHVRATIIAV
jgi:hypothetical protein